MIAITAVLLIQSTMTSAEDKELDSDAGSACSVMTIVSADTDDAGKTTKPKKVKRKSHKKETLAQRLSRYIRETESQDCLISDGKALLCTLCDCAVGCGQIGQVRQHLGTNQHRCAKKRKEDDASTSKKRQEQLTETVDRMRTNSIELNEFFNDTATAFAAADVPFNKLNHTAFKEYLEKYMKRKVPDESTVRKLYLERSYDLVIEKIREALKDKYVYIQVDETTIKGRKIEHLLVGALDSEASSIPFLLACEQVEKANTETTCQFINESLRILWPDRIEYGRLLVLISDSASYMKSAYNGLKTLYPKLLHVTCLAHGLHLICDKIRVTFPVADAVVTEVKKVFNKAPGRVSMKTIPSSSSP